MLQEDVNARLDVDLEGRSVRLDVLSQHAAGNALLPRRGRRALLPVHLPSIHLLILPAHF